MVEGSTVKGLGLRITAFLQDLQLFPRGRQLPDAFKPVQGAVLLKVLRVEGLGFSSCRVWGLVTCCELSSVQSFMGAFGGTSLSIRLGAGIAKSRARVPEPMCLHSSCAGKVVMVVVVVVVV